LGYFIKKLKNLQINISAQAKDKIAPKKANPIIATIKNPDSTK